MNQVRLFLPLAALALVALFPVSLPAQFDLGAAPEPLPRLSIGLIPAQGGYSGLELEVEIPSGTHISHQEAFFSFYLEGSDGRVRTGQVLYPRTDYRYDGIPAYQGTLVLGISFTDGTLKLADLDQGILKVHWQICTDAGLCYPPRSSSWELSGLTLDTSRRVLPMETGNLGPSLFTVPPEVLKGPLVAPDLGTLLFTLLMALMGGLLLNLMPCVLPVLSLKALSVVKQANLDPAQRAKAAWASFGGTVVSLQVLAALTLILQAGGSSLGWGFQFQSPWFSLALVALLLAFSLNLFGVWEFRGPRLRTGTGIPGKAQSSLASAFFNGILMVLLATPCSAPFLGTALGLTLTAPWWLTILTFLFLGLGLGLPMLLVSLLPRLGAVLPKPGPWMDNFKRFMGFCLLGTAVWLLTVLQTQVPGPAFSLVLIISFALSLVLWLAGIFQGSKNGLVKGILVLVLSTAFLIYGLFEFNRSLMEPQEGIWEPYTDQALSTAQSEGRPVFINFTANWCLTCQLNKASTLGQPELEAAFRKAGVKALEADWTLPDPEIERALARYGRNSVPLYVLVSPSGVVRILPEILSPDLVLSELRNMGPSSDP